MDGPLMRHSRCEINTHHWIHMLTHQRQDITGVLCRRTKVGGCDNDFRDRMLITDCW